MEHSDLIKIYFPIFITYLALVLTTSGYNGMCIYLIILIIIILSFLISYLYLIEKPPLEFKNDIEQKDGSIRIVFHFKNNTKKPITVRWYQFEFTKNDKTTFFNRHSYGRVIHPSRKSQQEEFGWTTPNSYGITEGGKCQILSIVGFIFDEEYKQLTDSWEGIIFL